MSSDFQPRHVEHLDLRMLGRCLDRASIFALDTDWRIDRRTRYGRFKADAARTEMSPEAIAASDRSGQFDVLHAAFLPLDQSPQSDLARWENEGGQPCRPAERGPYLFGRRLEIDGTWTIYHVFTGLPAQYGDWSMEGLTKAVASRALRTVNTPARTGDR